MCSNFWPCPDHPMDYGLNILADVTPLSCLILLFPTSSPSPRPTSSPTFATITPSHKHISSPNLKTLTSVSLNSLLSHPHGPDFSSPPPPTPSPQPCKATQPPPSRFHITPIPCLIS
ncbi:hypothetical protein L6452_43522 [Arctium lappa]|uniref:Uncharacterized protein n=1 Tax=Arctium lappa TaxID=4217 RepID=A0ACB8XD65_ARCLA|nr:hypothetical protein L6452_43522 [Arctium lappa]